MRFKVWKIDWPNHLIGFFSALFGILIAFELDQWRETKNNHEDARNAFEKIKKEILVNKETLHAVVSENLKRLELIELEFIPHINEKLGYNGSTKAAMTINTRVYPAAIIHIADTSFTNINTSVTVNLGSLSHPILHYSAWESAKATGVINYLEYEKVLAISYLYSTERIVEELQEIRFLLRKSDEINSKIGLEKLLSELKESHMIIQSELANYDTFANMVQSME